MRSRGVWFGFAENMFMFCLAKFRKHVFSEDDCHPSLNLHSFTNIGWSLQLLEKTWQQLFLWVINLCLLVYICVVIAREIFLLQSDCTEITIVHNKFKNNNKNGNFSFKCCWWPVGVCSVPSECLSSKISCSWSSDKFVKSATCEFFLIRLYFCCLLDQDLKGQCR